MFQQHREAFELFVVFLWVLCGKKYNRKERKVFREVRKVLVLFICNDVALVAVAMLFKFDIGISLYYKEDLSIHYTPGFLQI